MGWFWFRTLHTGAASHATSHRGDMTASYLSHYLWDSLVAQRVKNLPTMRETWVQFLGWEDPLEEGMATQSTPVFLPENPHGRRSLVGCSPWGCKESDTTERLSTARRAWGGEPGISTF